MNLRLADQLWNEIDARIQRSLAAFDLVQIRYGFVSSVDTVNKVCGVKLNTSFANRAGATESPGFAYPSFYIPVVDDYVRVVIDPKGDRWLVDKVLAAV